MDKSSSQGWSHGHHIFSSVEIEANLYAVYTVITSEASQNFRSSIARKFASLQLTTIHLLTWSSRIPSIDGVTIQILNINEMVTR